MVSPTASEEPVPSGVASLVVPDDADPASPEEDRPRLRKSDAIPMPAAPHGYRRHASDEMPPRYPRPSAGPCGRHVLLVPLGLAPVRLPCGSRQGSRGRVVPPGIQHSHHLGHGLVARARFEGCRAEDHVAEPRGNAGSVAESGEKVLVVGIGPREHEAQEVAQGVDVRAGVSLAKAVLLGGGEPAGPQGTGVPRGVLAVQAGDSEVDEVRAVICHHDVSGGDVAMDHSQAVERRERLGNLTGEADRLIDRERPTCANDLAKAPSGHVVVDHHELVGQLVGRLHVGKPRALGRGKEGPHRPLRVVEGKPLADEGPGAVEAHELGRPVGVRGEDLLDLVGVVERQGVYDLVVVHHLSPSPPEGTRVFSPRR